MLRSFDSDAHRTRPARPSPLTSSTIAGMPLDLLDRIRNFPLFASAPEQFLLEVAQHLRPQLLAQNEEVVREGEQGRSMWWVVRGAVRVTSRDGESTYAELRAGTFFGEIGILMGMPRTASVVATVKTLVVRLNKEDLERLLTKEEFKGVRRAIVEEAEERLRLLEKKKKELVVRREEAAKSRIAKRARDTSEPDAVMLDSAADAEVRPISTAGSKKRKSPSPGLAEAAASSALGSGTISVRQTLKELPLFNGLPPEILHFLGLNAQPKTYPPFTEIIKQDSQGRDVFFIIRGEVEIINEKTEHTQSNGTKPQKEKDDGLAYVKARLKAGQYFGEVTSLSLAPRRTATVRSVDGVECLVVSGSVLDELWQRCSPDLRRQVEATARDRLTHAAVKKGAKDVVMLDITPTASATHGMDELAISPSKAKRNSASMPTVQISGEPQVKRLSWESGPPASQQSIFEPFDPDPFLNAELENMRSRSRRGSLAPPGSQTAMQPPTPDTNISRSRRGSLAPPTTVTGQDAMQQSPQKPHPPPLLLQAITRLGSGDVKWSSGSPPGSPKIFKRPKISRNASKHGKGRLADSLLIQIFKNLDILQLMRLRCVSVHWNNLLSNNPEVLEVLDLSSHNRIITDAIMVDRIVPFIESRKGRGGLRIQEVNIDNCFHLSDEGFLALSRAVGTPPVTSNSSSPTASATSQPSSLLTIFGQTHNTGPFMGVSNSTKTEGVSPVRFWHMKSCWDITGQAILSMIDMNKGLQFVDLSNCRKVGDNLLARVVGWIVPELPAHLTTPAMTGPNGVGVVRRPNGQSVNGQRPLLPGSVVGLASLTSLTLSYCKHITDRSMAHIAAHMSKRLESLDLTRCTSISDQGFAHWAVNDFPKLRKLCLRDCTYLSDRAIVGICQGLGRGMSGVGGGGLGMKSDIMGGYGNDGSKNSIGLKELDLVSSLANPESRYLVRRSILDIKCCSQ